MGEQSSPSRDVHTVPDLNFIPRSARPHVSRQNPSITLQLLVYTIVWLIPQSIGIRIAMKCFRAFAGIEKTDGTRDQGGTHTLSRVQRARFFPNFHMNSARISCESNGSAHAHCLRYIECCCSTELCRRARTHSFKRHKDTDRAREMGT